MKQIVMSKDDFYKHSKFTDSILMNIVDEEDKTVTKELMRGLSKYKIKELIKQGYIFIDGINNPEIGGNNIKILQK